MSVKFVQIVPGLTVSQVYVLNPLLIARVQVLDVQPVFHFYVQMACVLQLIQLVIIPRTVVLQLLQTNVRIVDCVLQLSLVLTAHHSALAQPPNLKYVQMVHVHKLRHLVPRQMDVPTLDQLH
jgi:hypothetical protein